MMYSEKMNEFFKKIPVTIPEPQPEDNKNKIQTLLTDMGGKWYINKLNAKLPPLKRPILSRKSHTKRRLYQGKKTILKNDNWNDWKLQTHWNKLEWVDPKRCNPNINFFRVSLFKIYIKNKYILCHWFGHSKMNPIDLDELFNREDFNNETSLTLKVNKKT